MSCVLPVSSWFAPFSSTAKSFTTDWAMTDTDVHAWVRKNQFEKCHECTPNFSPYLVLPWGQVIRCCRMIYLEIQFSLLQLPDSFSVTFENAAKDIYYNITLFSHEFRWNVLQFSCDIERKRLSLCRLTTKRDDIFNYKWVLSLTTLAPEEENSMFPLVRFFSVSSMI